MKRLLALMSAVLVAPVALAAIIPAPIDEQTQPSQAAVDEIPQSLLPVYVAASYQCAGLPWQVLAGIGWAESRHAQGRVDPVSGEVEPPIIGPAIDGRPGFAAIPDPASHDGWAHALGPMQMLSTTFARWSVLSPDRPPGTLPDPQNAWDAIYSAASYLCADSPQIVDLDATILRYNHARSYVQDVLAKATEYGWAVGPPVGGPIAAGSGEAVVAAAMTQIGVPYSWGGASPATGFDCSGLVQWAYAQTGVTLPRTTSGQILAGVQVDRSELRPGDLVFTRSVRRGGQVVERGHVAIYAGGGQVVVAPKTGDVVRLRTLNLDTVQAARRVALHHNGFRCRGSCAGDGLLVQARRVKRGRWSRLSRPR